MLSSSRKSLSHKSGKISNSVGLGELLKRRSLSEHAHNEQINKNVGKVFKIERPVESNEEKLRRMQALNKLWHYDKSKRNSTLESHSIRSNSLTRDSPDFDKQPKRVPRVYMIQRGFNKMVDDTHRKSEPRILAAKPPLLSDTVQSSIDSSDSNAIQDLYSFEADVNKTLIDVIRFLFEH